MRSEYMTIFPVFFAELRQRSPCAWRRELTASARPWHRLGAAGPGPEPRGSVPQLCLINNSGSFSGDRYFSLVLSGPGSMWALLHVTPPGHAPAPPRGGVSRLTRRCVGSALLVGVGRGQA